MSKIYSQAPSGVAERVAHLIKVFHPELKDAGVKIDLLSVADDDPEVEHALKVRGIPAYATCRAVDIKGRTMGRGDAEIVIDEARFLTMPDATKDAVLDHELEHIEIQFTKKGKVKLDCCRRPKIKMKLHDVEFGWFESIAKRHGVASIECKQATKLFVFHEQTFFGFVHDPAMIETSPTRLVDHMVERAKEGAGMEGFRELTKDGQSSVTIRAASGKEVTIDKDGVR